MRRKAASSRLQARWIVSASLAIAFAGILLPWTLSRSTLAETEPEEGDSYFIKILGPNDGEPINSRVQFKVQTNYRENGVIDVALNEAHLYSRTLYENGYWEKSLFTTHVTIDLIAAGKTLGQDLLHPDTGPVRLSLRLFTPRSRFVASYLWTGFIGKPWLELVAKQAGGNLVAPSPIPRIVLHPLVRDVFYLVVTSQGREVLSTLTPDNPRLLREARLLSSGPCSNSWDPAGGITLDSLNQLSWRQYYVVLWTYDVHGSWKRSPILSVVR